MQQIRPSFVCLPLVSIHNMIMLPIVKSQILVQQLFLEINILAEQIHRHMSVRTEILFLDAKTIKNSLVIIHMF